MDMGLIGATVGTVIGLLGAAIGIYFGIKGTKMPAERSFAIKYVIGGCVAWILLIGLPLVLSLIGIIPSGLSWATLTLFFILLVPAIFWGNRRQAALRGEKA
jgi:Ca2+/Na+ antiporter